MAKHPPLMAVYETLSDAWGPQHWWPGRTRLEIIVGAILTQNTAWTNVEKAIRRLKREGALSLPALHHAQHRELADWIRPAGYFNIKARRLRAFTQMVYDDFGGSLPRLFGLETGALRETLLGVNGIGPETADSILLYAGGRPVFVVDAYTRRFLTRHNWAEPTASYDEIAELMTASVPRDVRVYNEYHALVVRLGKEYCRKHPKCDICLLQRWLPGRRRVRR